MSRKTRVRRSETPAKEIQNVVFMTAVSSIEHVVREGQVPRRVLSDIHLSIERGEIWGVSARTETEIRLLLEIMGNIRPYDGGKCVLIERGMMRLKRVIQQHVFYIGDADMLYGNMNALEYLMFATSKIQQDRLLMQEELFEELIDIGLGDISLSGIKYLTAEEKSVIVLIAAAYSDSLLIVFNLPEQVIDERLSGAIAKVAGLITQRGKTLVIGTLNCELIQKACTHTAFIADGRIVYQGTTDALRREFDKIAVIIRDPELCGVKQKLACVLTDCVLIEKEGSLLVKANSEASTPRRIYQQMLEAGVLARTMQINEKTIANAYEELLLLYDQSEQLF